MVFALDGWGVGIGFELGGGGNIHVICGEEGADDHRVRPSY